MGKILLHNMRFYGYHGVLEEENRLGQEFQIDVELTFDFDKAIRTDDVRDTIDYSKVYEIAKNNVEKKKFNLIEALAGNILEEIKKEYDNELVNSSLKIKVRVRKPSAPISGIFDFAQVEVEG